MLMRRELCPDGVPVRTSRVSAVSKRGAGMVGNQSGVPYSGAGAWKSLSP